MSAFVWCSKNQLESVATICLFLLSTRARATRDFITRRLFIPQSRRPSNTGVVERARDVDRRGASDGTRDIERECVVRVEHDASRG